MNSAVEQKKKDLKKLRLACWTGIFLAGIFSIWANVLHAGNYNFVRWMFAAAPPIVVLTCWEYVSRIPIPEDAKWWRKIVRPTVTASLAVGAAWLSYWAQHAAILRYSDDRQAAYIMPLLIDGVMVIASVSTYELNLQLRKLNAFENAREAGRAARTTPKPERPVKQNGPSQRERVATVFAKYPEASVKELARLAGVKEPYAYNVIGQLRKAAEPELQSA